MRSNETNAKGILLVAVQDSIFEAKFVAFHSQFQSLPGTHHQIAARPHSAQTQSNPPEKTFSFFTKELVIRVLGLLLVAFVFNSCSQEKRTWSSLAWHNTLAHYNGYFIAREKMKEFETAQLETYKENYNKILEVYPFPPLGSAPAANTPMEEVIKKASIPIQRHKNSDWVDDCYQLIGQARFYKEDWENAIQTFKFINTKFKDPDSKHKAVIWLLITYTRMGDFSNAKSVIAYLKKETLSKANLREGALAFAYFYQKKKEYQKMADYLAMGVELMPRGKRKGRLMHALGQLQQKYQHEPQAYAAYREVLRNRPSFELEFYTRLNMAQVVEITDEKQLKKIRKNFRRMTTDLKYEDYLDKVYYEMGMFEIKQNNMTKGLALLRESLKKGKGNSNQKPYTYMKLAELHYKPLRSYVWAKNYYDSCVQGLDTTDDNYKFVAKRKKVLTDFVVHYQTVVLEDSLLALSRMDSNQLYALVDQMIMADKERARRQEEQAKKLAAGGGGGGDAVYNSAFDNLTGGPTGSGPNPNSSGGSWYFSNVAAVAAGRSDFKRKWGDRKLEDNWRRSSKENQFSDDEPSASGDSSQAKNPDDKALADGKGGDSKGKKDEKAPELTQAQLRQQYLKNIPVGAAGAEASHAKIMVALLEMGKIYDQQLEEPILAAEALERDVKDYPTFEKRPEALYNLCLIYRRLKKDEDYERCKSLLLSNHPESVFAKLIVNPNYLMENKQRNEIIAGHYKTVFDQYKAKQFIEATNGIANIKSQFPKSDFEDKLAILSALITAKTVDLNSYKLALRKFMEDFPKSDLQEFAKKCLENADKATGGNPGVPAVDSSALASKPKAPSFNENLNLTQFFLALIPTLNIPESDILAALSDFNTKFYPGEELSVTSLPFGDSKHVMIKIQELPSKIQGMYYLKKMQESGPFKKDFKDLKPVYLLATQENLQTLYRTKAINDYVVFYTKNYNLSKELDDDIPGFGK